MNKQEKLKKEVIHVGEKRKFYIQKTISGKQNKEVKTQSSFIYLQILQSCFINCEMNPIQTKELLQEIPDPLWQISKI